MTTVRSIERKTGKNYKGEDYTCIMVYFSLFDSSLSSEPLVMPIFSADKINSGLFNALSALPRADDKILMDSSEFKDFIVKNPHFMHLDCDRYTIQDGKVLFQDGCCRIRTKSMRIDGKEDGEPQRFYRLKGGEKIMRHGKPIVETHTIVWWSEIYDEVESLISGTPVWISLNGGATPEESATIGLKILTEWRYEPVTVKSLSEAVETNDSSELASGE